MTELTEKEKAHAALDKLASGTPLTDTYRLKLCDDLFWYIRSLEDEVGMLGGVKYLKPATKETYNAKT